MALRHLIPTIMRQMETNLELAKERFDQDIRAFIEQLQRYHQDPKDSEVFFECLRLLHHAKVIFEEMQLESFQLLLGAMEHVFRAIRLDKVSWNQALMDLFIRAADVLRKENQKIDAERQDPDFSKLLSELEPYQVPLWKSESK